MTHTLLHEVPNLANYWTLAKLILAQLNKLTPHQFIALGFVAAQGVMSFKELRRVLALPMSSFTFLADRLEKRILVKRERAANDRRQWLLRVTPDGRKLVSDMREKEPAVLQSLLSLVPPDEKAKLSEALNRLPSLSKEDNQITRY
jgi:MarR family 2-MHQ and catechol resistance regulon transcriptional repressor